MRFFAVGITLFRVVWLQYPDVLIYLLKKAKIKAENLVSEQRIIEADRNVVLIWGRNKAENVA